MTEVIPLRRPARCPGCGRPAARDTHPFCSKRCQQIDLARWLKEEYRIPAEDGPPGPDDDPA
ncbi:MAG: hypothetical protein OHK0024_11620 [Thalassobaculales bacterium]